MVRVVVAFIVRGIFGESGLKPVPAVSTYFFDERDERGRFRPAVRFGEKVPAFQQLFNWAEKFFRLKSSGSACGAFARKFPSIEKDRECDALSVES